MKRRSTIKALASVAFGLFSTVASATTLTVNCSQIALTVPPAVSNGASNCLGFGILPVGSVITGLNMQFAFDFQFNNLDPGTRQVTFGTDGPGATFDLAGIMVDEGTRSLSGQVFSGDAAGDYALLANAFQVIGNWSATTPPVTGVTLDFRFNLDYLPETVVPETTTFGLVGAGLLGLGFMRRRPRTTTCSEA